MITIDNISVYIFNWKKVSQNSIRLFKKIKKYIKDVTIINCDESLKLDDSIKSIQLDDSHYYGSQYERAINDVKENNVFCVIVGDNISENNFENIFTNAVEIFNKYKVGIYSPHDKRSGHQNRNGCIEENVYFVENTDCGFWFIHPEIVMKLKHFKYGTLSPLGWGIDVITSTESSRFGFKVLRDYRVTTDQIDRSTNYDKNVATKGMIILFKEYIRMNS